MAETPTRTELLSKVPAITLGFWIIKILATTLGETGGDTVSMSWLGGGYEINPGGGNRDFWQAGIAITRDLSDRLQLGTEVSWQSSDLVEARARPASTLVLSKNSAVPPPERHISLG